MNHIKPAEAIKIAHVFRFLAQIMRYPDKARMGDQFFKNLFNLAEGVPFELDCSSCKDLLANDHTWLDMIQVEYTRLFINTFPTLIAPPYGSMYNATNLQGVPISLEMIEMYYHDNGYVLEQAGEPADWLVYELEFMAVLALSDQDGLEDFIDNLFRPWFIIFVQRVKEESADPYFHLVLSMIDLYTS